MLSILVAIAENGVIGRDNDLPWRLSADLRRFKQLTMGHHIIMGRKTYDSIGRLLPGRTTVVLTRQQRLQIDGAHVVHDLDQALYLAGQAEDEEAFVIGGSEVFAAALPRADRLYLTRVHANVQGDVHFPEFDAEQWEMVEQQQHKADEKNEFDYSFCVYERRDHAA